jgi:hypothetical protein
MDTTPTTFAALLAHLATAQSIYFAALFRPGDVVPLAHYLDAHPHVFGTAFIVTDRRASAQVAYDPAELTVSTRADRSPAEGADLLTTYVLTDGRLETRIVLVN